MLLIMHCGGTTHIVRFYRFKQSAIIEIIRTCHKGEPMVLKIGDSNVSQLKRTKIGGTEEVITERKDASGNISVSYHLRTTGGEEVTLHEDEALIQDPDSARLFKLIDGTYQLKEILFFSPTGEVKSADKEEEKDQMDHDRHLIESARHMFVNAQEEHAEFSKVEEELL